MSQRWLVVFTAAIAIFLFAEGGSAAYVATVIPTLEVTPDTAFATAEDIAKARDLLPAVYLVAVEGFLFGVISVACAIGLVMRKPWAHRALLVTSIFLAITAAIAIGMAPQRWDKQAVFVLSSALLWWDARKRRTT